MEATVCGGYSLWRLQFVEASSTLVLTRITDNITHLLSSCSLVFNTHTGQVNVVEENPEKQMNPSCQV